jgi:hypothetical protein
MRKLLLVSWAVVASLDFVGNTEASVLYNAPYSLYQQNFDTSPTTPINASLGNSPIGWTDDTTTPGANQFSILGWHLWHPTSQAEGGANGRQRMRIGSGNVNTGAFMSFGANNVAERALGAVASNTLTPTPAPPAALPEIYTGLRLTNNTGGTLVSFTVTYFGEQWRDGGDAAPNAQSLTVGNKLTASGAGPLVQDSGFTAVPALTFTSPVFANTGGGAAVNGNTVGRVGPITATITGINWAPNTDLWIRWTDQNNVGNDHGLGIDDVAFSAITPEPVSALVWACLAMIGIGGYRRLR